MGLHDIDGPGGGTTASGPFSFRLRPRIEMADTQRAAPHLVGAFRREKLGLAGRDESTERPDDAGLLAGSDAAAPGAESAASARRGRAAEPAALPDDVSSPETDRRNHSDRRDEPTSFLSSPFRRGRRKAGRRNGERDNIYVDVYSPTDVLILLGIFTLNIGDALFTLLWLQRGGAEGNPVMQAMLDIGVGAFLFQKCIIVGLWLLVLTVHRNYRAARLGLWSTLTVYTLIVMYHLVLVGFDVDPVIGEPGDAAAAQELEMAPEQYGDGGLDAQDPLAQRDGP